MAPVGPAARLDSPTMSSIPIKPGAPPLPRLAVQPGEILPGLVFGYRFGTDGAHPLAAPEEVAIPAGDWLWLHVNLADMRCRPWLAGAALLPGSGSDHVFAKDDTLALATSGEQATGTFFDLTHELAVSDEDFGPLRFALSGRVLVSGRRTPLRSVEALRHQIRHGRGFASPAGLLLAIAEQIAFTFDAAVDRLSEEVDRVEDMLLKDRLHDDRQALGTARLTSVRIHRRITGMRALFRRLDRDAADPVAAALVDGADALIPRFDDIDQSVIELRDRSRLLQDELGVRLAEQTNRQLRILSVLTALFLPPTLITGLFGMNVTALPFSADGGGFWWVIAVIAAVCGVTLWALARAGVLK